MSDPQKTVFISYRCSVSSFIARAIFQDLRRRRYDVFMDVENINSGQFDTILLNQIAARAHFLVILTPGTIERCVDSDDWLRCEIEHAMDLKRNIVPILVNKFTFDGTETYLTGKLSELYRFNGLTLPHDYFEEAMNRLCKRYLKQPMYGEIKSVPRKEQVEAMRRIDEVARQSTPTEKQLTAEQYFTLGYECNEKGDYTSAIENYTEALRLNPQFAAAYNNRGLIRGNNGDINGAIADYNEALRLNPQLATAYNNRGLIRREQGDLDGAIADYNEALRLNPQYATAYNNRGWDNEQKRNYYKALADYEAALRIDPQHKLAKNNRENLVKKMRKRS